MASRTSQSRRGQRSDGTHWISYSDMMASLLLVFVMVLVYSIYQYFEMLSLKTAELDIERATVSSQQAELDSKTLALVSREDELKTAQADLKGKEKELALIQIELETQQGDLKAAQAALALNEDQQALLQLQLDEQKDKLDAMNIVLSQKETEMRLQAARIDNLLGIRTEIIEDLSAALKRANVAATVDAQTGDIVLASKVFYDTASSIIKPDGLTLLDQFVPVYMSVLLDEKYVDYLAEIIIEGHTDSAGTYINNLKLSQNRALSVATYCLEMTALTPVQRLELQRIMTAKGRSSSSPVYRPDGSEDMDSSRRVEFKFRLKDSEMIEQMSDILSGF